MAKQRAQANGDEELYEDKIEQEQQRRKFMTLPMNRIRAIINMDEDS
jgi:hypothetical protein